MLFSRSGGKHGNEIEKRADDWSVACMLVASKFSLNDLLLIPIEKLVVPVYILLTFKLSQLILHPFDINYYSLRTYCKAFPQKVLF